MRSVSVTDTQTPGVLTVRGLTTPGETTQVIYGPITSLTTSSVATVAAGSRLVSYEQDFDEEIPTTVPEPASLLLLGSTLIA